MLHQINRVASIGLHKIRQQAVRAITSFTPDSLYRDAVVDVAYVYSPLVGSPTDQMIGIFAFRMGTFLGNGELAPRKSGGFGVILCGTGKVLDNDHIFETPLLVIKLPSMKLYWEVLSFLTRLYTIIPTCVCPVKLERSCHTPGVPYLLFNQCDCLFFVSNFYLRTNYPIGPGLAVFRPTNLAANKIVKSSLLKKRRLCRE